MYGWFNNIKKFSKQIATYTYKYANIARTLTGTIKHTFPTVKAHAA